jgi:hypothetical protein
MNIAKNTFSTSDLFYAAFLKTAGFSLSEIKKTEGGKRIFVFEDNSGLIQKAQTDYVNGVSKIGAKEFIDNIRALKTLINMG